MPLVPEAAPMSGMKVGPTDLERLLRGEINSKEYADLIHKRSAEMRKQFSRAQQQKPPWPWNSRRSRLARWVIDRWPYR